MELDSVSLWARYKILCSHTIPYGYDALAMIVTCQRPKTAVDAETMGCNPGQPMGEADQLVAN